MEQTEAWENTNHRALAPNDGSELLVCALARALQASGAVETLHASSVHPVDGCCEGRAFGAHSSIAAVSLHVHNEDRWREVVMIVATAVRAVPGITLVVSFAHPGELRLEVFPGLPITQQRYLLDRALQEAAQAVLNWCQSIDGPVSDGG